jgi:hypothetical protein
MEEDRDRFDVNRREYTDHCSHDCEKMDIEKLYGRLYCFFSNRGEYWR